MSLHSYRVRVSGGEWSRWADWSNTPSSMLVRESRNPVPRKRVTRESGENGVPDGQMPIVVASRVAIDYSQPIAPPGWKNTTGSTGVVSPDELRELVSEMGI